MEEKKMMHVGIRRGDIGRYVFLPGSPERSERIAACLEGAREIAYHREYRTFTGTLEGVAVSVTSTGMGGPSVGIAVEELYECGADTMIRIGTCESASTNVHTGDLVLPNGAVRMEGVAQHYLPMEYPAVPSMELLQELEAAAQKMKLTGRVGITITKACFSTQFRGASRPMGYEISQRWKAYEAGGALCADMACAPLFVIAGSLGIRAAAVMGVSCEAGNYSDDAADWPVECEERAIQTGVEAMRSIIQMDREVAKR